MELIALELTKFLVFWEIFRLIYFKGYFDLNSKFFSAFGQMKGKLHCCFCTNTLRLCTKREGDHSSPAAQPSVPWNFIVETNKQMSHTV